MVCRHIKVSEIYNFILHADTIENVKLEYTKISNADTSFELLGGNLTEIDNNLYIKEISFPEAGEYMVRVTIGEAIEYERYKIYNFSEEDTQATINNIYLAVENIKSELNEELLFLRKQLKIINAQL